MADENVSDGPFVAAVVVDAGLVNIVAVLLVGLTCGTLNRWGVDVGGQIMSLSAARWSVAHLM